MSHNRVIFKKDKSDHVILVLKICNGSDCPLHAAGGLPTPGPQPGLGAHLLASGPQARSGSSHPGGWTPAAPSGLSSLHTSALCQWPSRRPSRSWRSPSLGPGGVAAAEGTQTPPDTKPWFRPVQVTCGSRGLAEGMTVAEGKPGRHPRCRGWARGDPVFLEAGRGQEGESEKPCEGLTLSCWL